MNFVLDTNVIVSAFYRKNSVPFEVFSYAFNKNNYVYYNESIFREYDRVLNKDKLKFNRTEVTRFLLFLRKQGVIGKIIDYHYAGNFIDESDRKFYELAKSYDCYLITGNKKHYPNDPIVLTPSEFMNKLRLSA